MFKVNEDLSIYVTRGDIVTLSVTAEDNGEAYVFQPGDLVRIKVFGKKDCETVVLQKDFPITSETEEVEIFLDERDTKIGGVISKPTDYWYEIELNPLSDPKTIIGYDEDGAKVFKLFPEGRDLTENDPVITPEDIPIVDRELDLTSQRPIENQAVARAVEQIKGRVQSNHKDITRIDEELSLERARINNIIAPNESANKVYNLAYCDYISSTMRDKIEATITTNGINANVSVTMREANLFLGDTGLEVFIIPNECRPFGAGTIHSADGLNFTITYDISADSYRLLISAQNGVIAAPSSAGVVTMSYALYDYEAKDIRVGADGTIYASAGEAVRTQFNKFSIAPRIEGDLSQIIVGDATYSQHMKQGIITADYAMPSSSEDSVSFASVIEVDINNLRNKIFYVKVKNTSANDMVDVDILLTNKTWGAGSNFILFAEAVTIKKGEILTQEIDFTDSDILSAFAGVTGNIKIVVKVPDKTSGSIVWYAHYKDYDKFSTSYAFNSVNADRATESDRALVADKADIVANVLEATDITKNMQGAYYDESDISQVCYYKDGICYYIDTAKHNAVYSAIKCLLGKKKEIVNRTIHFKYTSATKIEIGLNNGAWWGVTSKNRTIGYFDVATDKAMDILLTSDILDADFRGGSFSDDEDVYLIIMVKKEIADLESDRYLAFRSFLSYVSDVGNIVKATHIGKRTAEEVESLFNGVQAVSPWSLKKWAAYGDSITAICNGNGLALGWAKYVNDALKFGEFFGRGVGGQRYAWGGHGGSVCFINEDGTLNSRNDSYNLDSYTGAIPDGCVAVRGAFCSWSRITAMFPESIKDTIDMVLVMGGTNDSADNEEAKFISGARTDAEWAASCYYATYGGDYNISSMRGGIASTVMKMQAWMPNALIVIGTNLSGRGESGKIGTNLEGVEYGKAIIEKEMASRLSCPCIDVYSVCGISPFNRVEYISDGVHPYAEKGKMMLGRAIIGGLNGIYPKIDI